MYQHDHASYMLTAVFVPAGVLLAAAGWWVKRRFQDPTEGQPGFRSWGLGPRGALELLGAGLMFLGAAAVLCGVAFPFILR